MDDRQFLIYIDTLREEHHHTRNAINNAASTMAFMLALVIVNLAVLVILTSM